MFNEIESRHSADTSWSGRERTHIEEKLLAYIMVSLGSEVFVIRSSSFEPTFAGIYHPFRPRPRPSAFVLTTRRPVSMSKLIFASFRFASAPMMTSIVHKQNYPSTPATRDESESRGES
jgi:hypothetical protein